MPRSSRGPRAPGLPDRRSRTVDVAAPELPTSGMSTTFGQDVFTTPVRSYSPGESGVPIVIEKVVGVPGPSV